MSLLAIYLFVYVDLVSLDRFRTRPEIQDHLNCRFADQHQMKEIFGLFRKQKATSKL